MTRTTLQAAAVGLALIGIGAAGSAQVDGKPGRRAGTAERPVVDFEVINQSEPPVAALPPVKELARRRIDAALEYLDDASTAYERGAISMDRLLDALDRYMRAKLDAAEGEEGRIAVAEEHVRFLRWIANREAGRVRGGVGTQLALSNAATVLADAEFKLGELRDRKPDPVRPDR